MPIEHFIGKDGQETDSQGIPWVEELDTKELRRLKFNQHLQQQKPDDHTPVISNPFPPDRRITTVDTNNPTSLGEFFNRHKRRGPYNK